MRQAGRGCGCGCGWVRRLSRKVCQTSRDFTSAFRNKPFRWYWTYLIADGAARVIENSFNYYWLEDCFDDYRFFGYDIGVNNVKSAVALNAVIPIGIAFCGVTLTKPHWWRERYGGRQVLLWGNLLTYCLKPFSYAFMPGNFTIVLLWTIFQGLVGAFTAAASSAIPMDCLPCDEEGKPLRAAQDVNMYRWGSLSPVTGFPLLIGTALNWFPSHDEAYAYFWFLGGVVGLVGYAILALLVHPQEEPLDRSCQCTRHWFHRERDARFRARTSVETTTTTTTAAAAAAAVLPMAPIGARLCDRLLFGEVVTAGKRKV
eukprot:SAG25_NODE_989_length_4394_cov_2.452386_3_plen_315_part_00